MASFVNSKRFKRLMYTFPVPNHWVKISLKFGVPLLDRRFWDHADLKRRIQSLKGSAIWISYRNVQSFTATTLQIIRWKSEISYRFLAEFLPASDDEMLPARLMAAALSTSVWRGEWASAHSNMSLAWWKQWKTNKYVVYVVYSENYQNYSCNKICTYESEQHIE